MKNKFSHITYKYIWKFENLKKKGVATLLGGITLDNYRKLVFSEAANQAELIKKSEAEKKEILEKAWNQQDLAENFKNKVDLCVNNVKDAQSQVENYSNQIKNVEQQLSSGKLELGNTIESINTNKKHYQSQLNEAKSNLSDAMQNLTDTVADHISKSDIGSFIWDLLEKYQSFLSTLSLAQHVVIFNLIGLISLLNVSFSLFSIFFGNIIIDKLNLQKRFPKLANYILLKKR